MNTRKTITNTTAKLLLAAGLCLAAVGCSGGVEVVRKDAQSGMLRLRGPLAPSHLVAREAMVDHCHGRYVIERESRSQRSDGSTERLIAYDCARALAVELAAR